MFARAYQDMPGRPVDERENGSYSWREWEGT